MSGLGFNAKFEQLKLRRATLKEQCADLIELYAHLVNVVGPNLKSEYLVRVGQLEHQVYELKVEIKRWQRRFALRQKELNKGAKPDLVMIEATLDLEFSSYMEEIKKSLEEIKKSVLHESMAFLSDEEANALRLAYHDAAKKLHPDINPNLSESAKNLWLQIQKAYEDHDWTTVKFLAGLVDGVISGEQQFSEDKDSMAALEESVAALSTKCDEIRKRIDDANGRPPLSYRDFLSDGKKVEECQSQLQAQISTLEGYVKEYEELWEHGK